MALAHRTDVLNRSRVKGHSETHRQGSSSGIITCFVTQPDNVVLHIDVDSKADGQEVLNKVCTLLGIQDEADYFGLQYALAKGDLIWLNLRNRLSKQLPCNPPYNLFFKVKYFVPPYNLVLEETKHQFYLNAAQQLKLGLWDAETSLDLQSRLIALMAYVQFGSFNSSTTPCKYACFWSDRREEIPHEVLGMAASYHKELHGMSTRSAEYELLRIAHEEVPAFGVYFYEIMDMYGHRLLMGVGPEYVAVCQTDTTFLERFPYCRLKTVTIAGRVVTLNLLEDDGSVKMRNYELSSKRASDSLYRSITELHCFFRCDNVRDDVLTRTNPSINLSSIFDHNGSREYTFDVRYTSREVQDRARRNLYHAANEASISVATIGRASPPAGSDNNSSVHSGLNRTTETSRSHTGSLTSMEEVQEIVQKVRREEVKCRVCLDRPVKCVFVPCGHFSCEDCSLRLTHCPVCRKAIEIRQTCYFPWDTPSNTVVRSTQPVCFALSVSESNLSAEEHSPSFPTPSTDANFHASSSTPNQAATAKPHRSVAFVEEETDGSCADADARHPGAFNFFHRQRHVRSSSTSSA
ncbi:unnamed protein product [Mesocestoides corti]|uniref:RING-type E3 ubiquitin transferase n=2 Tax=Mesocestoides corti TaxID=53468 RepID=A0A158QV77_MESCO|nr:unnamed protein product [Mesocestoides corti]